MSMFCQTCGHSVSETAASCSNCSGDLAGGTPKAPYQPMVENHFMGAAALIALFPLMGGLLPVAVDSPLVRLSGWAVLIISPLIGIAAIVISTAADKLRNNGQMGKAIAKSKQAGMITKVGLLIGFIVAGFGVAVAFVNFLSGSNHEARPETDQPAAVAPAEEPAADPTEAATDETPPAEDKAPTE